MEKPSHIVDMFVERTTLQAASQTVVVLIEERAEDEAIVPLGDAISCWPVARPCRSTFR